MTPTTGNPSVALAHDILAARAGGERVLAALSQAFPKAPIHTLLHEPGATFEDFGDQQVQASWLGRFAWLRRNYRAAVPAAALTFAAKRIDADVTICSSSGLSHQVRTTGAKLVYCHTPARWLHDSQNYLGAFHPVTSAGARALAPGLRRLDHAAMSRADRVIANSHHIAGEIGQIYGIDAEVIAPCSTLDLDGPVEPLPGVLPGFVLTAARPLGYKRLDVLVEAARRQPDRRFVHVGEGPHRRTIFADAPTNLVSFGAVSDARLRWLYRNAEVVAVTCAEDFGLVPLEAAAHGVHTVAPDARGIKDHGATDLTPYLFASPGALAEAIDTAPSPTGTIRPELLGRERFARQIRAIVQAVA